MTDESKKGIQETKEALVGINELSLAVAKALKDGFQPIKDGLDIYEAIKTPEVSAKLAAALDKIGEVPAELSDCDLVESVELVTVQASYVPKLVEALKK